MGDLLDVINGPNDIKKISPKDYRRLAGEIRQFLVRQVSRTGGHLSSNLGVVELTMALHLCCDLPNDRIVWDVGHQSYTHKILTGRKEDFSGLRQYGGMSGFPKRRESECDAFNTGHSSTSISAALGFARARDIKNEKRKIFAVIGDGALSGGMAYEGLNNAAGLRSNLIIVLNDNQMSISKNVGGMAEYIGSIRTNTNYTGLKENVEKILRRMPHVGSALAESIMGAKDVIKRIFVKGMLFEDMGLTYIGPIDGHDIKQMVSAFESASKVKKAVVVHVCTKKGKGYPPAEKDPAAFHGVAPFFVRDGTQRVKSLGVTYTQIFSRTLLELAGSHDDLTAVSAAMPAGTGLLPMAEKYPGRFFDVGIAEEHAVTFAAGMAAGGLHPIVAIYSTFLQRAYDQILHDVCMCALPVTFAIDRAGIVGSDGETHQGVFDISFLESMPNMTIMAPKNGWELKRMLEFAAVFDGPLAIRYPRGRAYAGLEEYKAPIEYATGEYISACDGGEWRGASIRIAILAVGSMVEVAAEAGKILMEEHGICAVVVNMRFIKPLDEKILYDLSEKCEYVATMEEGVVSGGFGQAVREWYGSHGIEMDVECIGLPDKFIEHGSAGVLREKYGLSAERAAERIAKGAH